MFPGAACVHVLHDRAPLYRRCVQCVATACVSSASAVWWLEARASRAALTIVRMHPRRCWTPSEHPSVPCQPATVRRLFAFSLCLFRVHSLGAPSSNVCPLLVTKLFSVRIRVLPGLVCNGPAAGVCLPGVLRPLTSALDADSSSLLTGMHTCACWNGHTGVDCSQCDMSAGYIDGASTNPLSCDC